MFAISSPSPATGCHSAAARSVEDARSKILTIENVGKVDIIGAQDEAIYLEFSTRKIAALGIDRQSIIATLQAQNAVTQSGFVTAGPERIAIRVGGQFASKTRWNRSTCASMIASSR